MAALSPTQDEALKALSQGKEIRLKEGKAYIGEKLYRSTSIEALNRRGLLHKDGDKYYLTEQGKTRASALSTVGENLTAHRPNRLQFQWYDRHLTPTFDVGQCDYDFWDRARLGQVKGLEIAGLFIKPIASKKAAWVLGELPQIRFDDEQTQEAVNEWVRSNHADILLAYEESAVMGDYYLVVNPDESVTIVPPNVVEPIVDETNFSRQIGWRISQAFSHPQKPWIVQTITDEYYADKRVLTITAPNGIKGKPQEFKNLTGLIPVFHIANNRRGGEMFGHPEAEALVQTLHNYGDVTETAIEGNLRQSRPTPVFESLGSQENLDAFIAAFGTTEYQLLPDGTREEVLTMRFSSDQVVYLGEDGKFKYASPGQFTGDTMNILQILFYLIIQHTEMPEFIWGGAIASSKASAEVQMPPFTKWVEKEQGRAEKWLLPLVTYYIALRSLYDRKVKYKPNQKPKIKWMPLTTKDDKLTLEAIKIALTLGKWKPEWVVPYMPLDIDNPEELIAEIIAQAEEEKRLADAEREPFNPGGMDDIENDEDDSPEGENPEEVRAESVMESLVKEAHTGVMVAFEMPITAAAALAASSRQSGIEPIAPDDMHITLAYLGQMDEIADKRKKLEAAIKKFVANAAAIDGSIGGVGRFNASVNSEGMDVLYASFDAPALPDFRQGLVAAIEKTGVEISRAHGFTPHITLSYIERGSEMPNLALETMALRFESVTLYWGDERVSFELKKELEAELA
jgi:2'-5' RNA ligase